MIYLFWLYVVPTLLLLVGHAVDYSRQNEYCDKNDWITAFVPGFNLIIAVIAIGVIVFTLFNDPKYFFTTWRNK